MSTPYQELMERQSDENLMVYGQTPERYQADAIAAAFHELRRRGRPFTEQDLEHWNMAITSRKQAETAEYNTPPITSSRKNNWTKNVVDDPSAPSYYSHRFIWVYSILFSVFAGSILLALNIKGKDRWMIVGFGLVYTVLGVVALSYIPIPGVAPTFAVNAGGAYLLNSVFWNKYIGENTLYRNRPIWTPLVIALIITVPIVILILMGMANENG